ncbi:MAG: RDD family protein [Bdellovibrionales bacterium]|nr:RDD family protein [Bdellovibrionales bacterium]
MVSDLSRCVFEEGTVRIHLVWVVYFVLVRLSYEGLSYYFFRSTLGKYLFNLRVVNRDHPDAPLELTQCYFRALVSELSFFVGWALHGTLFFVMIAVIGLIYGRELGWFL